ncbi:MAG: catalase/peroxidase HPI [Clostridium sp.]|uniref:catalase/peroxidase HPI n=1 Tax=Clostridium sp. TaxID=1506 RepID=UPI003F41AF84
MSEMRCPVTGKTRAKDREGLGGGQDKNKEMVSDGTSNKEWWPDSLNLKILSQNSEKVSPMDKDFDYVDEFNSLNYEALKEDIKALMTDSKDWWPADYGHYGPFFIRMAWHSAGTYRIGDGRGGSNSAYQRFAPLNSWPDNINLDKARRLLWPIKQKYGNKISWADLIILTGNCAFESMGLKMVGFGGGRKDVFEPEEDTYWGKEKKWLDNERYEALKLEDPLAAVQMGLIYVNPEGPDGEPSAIESGKDVRETFRRMGMNDEETVALVAGGHTFGKSHGAAKAKEYVGKEPEGAAIEEMGLGWKSSFKSGKGRDTISNGIEGAWNSTPTAWDMNYFDTLFRYEWDLHKGPGGAFQWRPTDPKAKETVPDAEKGNAETHAPMMTTADLSLRMDQIYEPIARDFHKNKEKFEKAFANAWFKLTHRDMGPKTKYYGPEVPEEDFIWQDPLPKATHKIIEEKDIPILKKMIEEKNIENSDLIYVAWGSASTFRGSDSRGGANGARIRLMPQIEWEVNEPERLKKVLKSLEEVKESFNSKNECKVSLADMIVLGGNLGIERAAKKANIDLEIPFERGRLDAVQEQTDVNSFKVLEPFHDPFRNYLKQKFEVKAEKLMVDKAQLLKLTAPELTVLLGGLRSLDINYKKEKHGVLTENPGVLSNDFFINILDMKIRWEKDNDNEDLFIGYDRETNEKKWTGTRVDLIFGSNSQLRAIAEIYASSDSKDKFLKDFVKAWNKVMNADRFDIVKCSKKE